MENVDRPVTHFVVTLFVAAVAVTAEWLLDGAPVRPVQVVSDLDSNQEEKNNASKKQTQSISLSPAQLRHGAADTDRASGSPPRGYLPTPFKCTCSCITPGGSGHASGDG